MRIHRWILLFWLLVSCGAAAAQKGPSPLRELASMDATRGWEAVGRLDLGHGAFCTGALIEPDLVLTAAHCLYHAESGARLPVGNMEFRAGWQRGRAEAYRAIRKVAVHPEFDFHGPKGASRIATDLALVRLERPIRLPQVQPFPTTRGLRRGDEVGVVSYAQDRSEAPSLQDVCHVMEKARGVVMLSCSVNFGSSGAPIFEMTKNGPAIASVVSAKAESGGQPVALGSTLTHALAEVRAVLDAVPQESRVTRGAVRMEGGGAKFIRP